MEENKIDPLSITNTNTYMTKRNIAITTGIIIIVIVLAIFGRPYNSRQAYEEKQAMIAQMNKPVFDKEAVRIQGILLEKTKQYRTKEERQTRYIAEMAELEAKVLVLEVEKMKIAETAANYDAILCSDYRVQYNRPPSGSGATAGSGSLMYTEKCSLTEGTSSAQ